LNIYKEKEYFIDQDDERVKEYDKLICEMKEIEESLRMYKNESFYSSKKYYSCVR